MEIKVYSYCEGWFIKFYDQGEIIGQWSFNHNEYEKGVGGEKEFVKVLSALNYGVSHEEVY